MALTFGILISKRLFNEKSMSSNDAFMFVNAFKNPFQGTKCMYSSASNSPKEIYIHHVLIKTFEHTKKHKKMIIILVNILLQYYFITFLK